jgi:hypothetical protein
MFSKILAVLLLNLLHSYKFDSSTFPGQIVLLTPESQQSLTGNTNDVFLVKFYKKDLQPNSKYEVYVNMISTTGLWINYEEHNCHNVKKRFLNMASLVYVTDENGDVLVIIIRWERGDKRCGEKGNLVFWL